MSARTSWSRSAPRSCRRSRCSTLVSAFADGIAKPGAAGPQAGAIEHYAPAWLAVRVRRLAEQQPTRSDREARPAGEGCRHRRRGPADAGRGAFAKGCGVEVSRRSSSSRLRRAYGSSTRHRGGRARAPRCCPASCRPRSTRCRSQTDALGRRHRGVRSPGALGADAVRREVVPANPRRAPGDLTYGHRFNWRRGDRIATAGYVAALERGR